MKYRRSFIAFVVIAIFLIFLSTTKSVYAQESKPEYVIKIGTLAPEGSVWMEKLKEIMNIIEQKTNSRVKNTFYPGGVMGDEPAMVKKMNLDQLQMGAFTIYGIYTIAPEMAVMELPFLFEDVSEVDYIRNRVRPVFDEIFEKKGFKLLSWVDQGGFDQIYSKHPIKNLNDLAKQKTWAWTEQPIPIETYKAIGIAPVTTSVLELLSSLQAGIVDAFYTTPLACLALQWCLQIRYINMLNFKYEAGAVVMTMKAWNSLPKDIRQIIINEVRAFEPKVIASIRIASDKALMRMIQEGIQVVPFDPAERELFKKKTRVIYQQLAGKIYSKDLLDRILKDLDKYRTSKKEN
ncbi:MAG TPA: TRAP transporter substrate-binding protein DctP [bacterium]